MKKIIFLYSLLIIQISLLSCNKVNQSTPEETIKSFLNAYNENDKEAYLSLFCCRELQKVQEILEKREHIFEPADSKNLHFREKVRERFDGLNKYFSEYDYTYKVRTTSVYGSVQLFLERDLDGKWFIKTIQWRRQKRRNLY